ncbi:MAG: glycosyltransferase [bacterium]
MNVLFMTHSFPRDHGDAAGSFVLRLARALKGEGVGVRVVAPAAPGLPSESVLNGIRIDRFRYAPRRYETLAYTGNMAAQVRDSWASRFALLSFIAAEYKTGKRVRREFRPSLVHAHWWFPNGLAASRVAASARIPLVTTMHGTDVRMARAIAASRPAFRYVLRKSAQVSVVSNWLADETEAVAGMRPTVAPMPVATEFFNAVAGTVRERRLLFVGRLMPQKGVHLLLDALATLPADVALSVIGDGPDRAALEARAGTLGIAERVRWLGALKQQELAPYYQRAAMLVVPSKEEGLGLVAVEAQLCETPVVAFASGGLPDVVQDGVTGTLVTDQSAVGLARAIQAVLDRDDSGASLGVAGRAHALATFSPESVARKYVEIYRTAVDASSR